LFFYTQPHTCSPMGLVAFPNPKAQAEPSPPNFLAVVLLVGVLAVPITHAVALINEIADRDQPATVPRRRPSRGMWHAATTLLALAGIAWRGGPRNARRMKCRSRSDY
jgi:4-hydroxybenzoate polyprenyltransferase